MQTLRHDEARCLGHGIGPGGWQVRMDCVSCLRRLAPRAGAASFTEPPSEFPCPIRIPVQQQEGV